MTISRLIELLSTIEEAVDKDTEIVVEVPDRDNDGLTETDYNVTGITIYNSGKICIKTWFDAE